MPIRTDLSGYNVVSCEPASTDTSNQHKATQTLAFLFGKTNKKTNMNAKQTTKNNNNDNNQYEGNNIVSNKQSHCFELK